MCRDGTITSIQWSGRRWLFQLTVPDDSVETAIKFVMGFPYLWFPQRPDWENLGDLRDFMMLLRIGTALLPTEPACFGKELGCKRFLL
jgi:hypothetical protein